MSVACVWLWITDHATVLSSVVTAIATAVIGLYTWNLARVSERQAKLTDDTIKLARDEFLASHRPELKIHSVRFLEFKNSPPPDQQPARAKFSIVNAGTAAGAVTGSAVYLDCIYPIDRPRLPELVRNDFIPPRRFDVGATDTFEIATDDMGGANLLGNKDKVLYLSGWIVYEDGRGHARTTYFRREYLRDETLRFDLVVAPDENCTY